MVSFKSLRSKKTDDSSGSNSNKRWSDGYSLPVFISLLIHCLAVFIAFTAWSPPAELRITPMPQHLAAKLVEIQKEKPKPAPKPESKPKSKPKPEPAPVRKPAPKPVPKPEKKTPAKDTKPKIDEKALQLKKEKEAKAKVEKEKREREAREKRQREEEQRKKDEARKKQERELAARLQREKAEKEAQAKAKAKADAEARGSRFKSAVLYRFVYSGYVVQLVSPPQCA